MPGIGRSAVLFAGEGRLAAGAHTIKDLVQVLAAGVAQGKNLLRGLLQIRHHDRHGAGSMSGTHAVEAVLQYHAAGCPGADAG